tara:strand:+ start:19 stop:273 length:255 start_codon:yes stop_codon:yes gene_type:complete
MDIYYIIFIIFFLIFLFTRIQIYFKTKHNIDILYKEIEAYIYDISKLKDENYNFKKKIDELKFTNNKLNTKIIILQNRKLLPPS